MGFDINSASKKPVIREAASMHNDGGGGNLGYFENGEHKEKKHFEESIFGHKTDEDTFKKESDHEDVKNGFSASNFIANFIAKLILMIKEWIKRIAS